MHPSRRSPAHQRVFQIACPRRGGRGEAAGRSRVRRLAERSAHERRQYPRQDGDHGRPHGTGRRQSHRHGGVGAVEQPGRRERRQQVSRRHGRAGVVRDMPVRHRGMPRVTGVTGRAGRGLVPGSRPGQGEVQPRLRHEGAADGHRQGEGAAYEGPGQRALGHREDGHQPPRHRLFGDGMVAEGREHTADEREQPGSRPRGGTVGLLRGHLDVYGGDAGGVQENPCSGARAAATGAGRSDAVIMQAVAEEAGTRRRPAAVPLPPEDDGRQDRSLVTPLATRPAARTPRSW